MRGVRNTYAVRPTSLFRSVIVVVPVALLSIGLFAVTAFAQATADLSKNSMSFSVSVGQTGNDSATLTNNGDTDLNVSSVADDSGDFTTDGSACTGAPVSAFGGQCTISVTFNAPQSPGTYTGTVTISTDIGDTFISLSGTAQGASASLIPSSLSFGTVRVGNTSGAQPASVSNTGNVDLHVSGVSATPAGDYTASSGCGTVTPGTSCSISVTFHPSAGGSQPGILTVTSDGVNGTSTRTSSLSGTGGLPALTLSTTSLSFGNQGLNTTSALKSVTVTNSGNASMIISSINTTGDFQQTKTCGSSLGVGLHCTVSITFRPTALGTRTGKTTIATDGGTKSVGLSGTGVAPSVSLSQATLNFGDIRVGKTSSPQTVTMKNIGTQTLHISGISAGNDFAESDACPSSLGIGQTCSISVTFHPTSLGVHNSQLIISGSSGTQTVGLTGRGVAPAVRLKPSSLDFGKQPVGLGSKPKTITLTNIGTAPLTVTAVSDFGNFSETDTCTTAPIAPGGTCIISVVFTPTDYDERKGAIAVDDDAGRQTVGLAGIGVTAASAGFGAGPNTPPYSPIPQSGPPGQTNQPPQAIGGGGGSRRTVAPIAAVGGGALVFILLAWFGLLWIRRRRRERPPPAPMPGEVPLMGSLEERGVDGQLFVSEPAVSKEVLEPVSVGIASTGENGFSAPSHDGDPAEAPPEPTPEEAPPEFPPAPAPPEEPAADRPLVPIMSSFEPADNIALEPPLTRSLAEVPLDELFENGQEHPSAPPQQPAPTPTKPSEEKRRGRKGRPESTLESVSSSPLLGLIERQMTDLDEQTDQLHDAPDDEPAS